MAKIDEWHSSTGAILHLNEVKIKPANMFPHGVVSMEFRLALTSGMINDDGGLRYNPSMSVFANEFNVEFAGIPIMQGTSNFHDYMPTNSKLPPITMMISIEALDFIESKRNDDITLNCFLSLTCKEETKLSDGREWVNYSIVDFAFPLDYSEKKWITFLSDLGYNDKWIIEMNRPKIEGFDAVVEHLRKAQDALYDKKESEDVLRDLRAAKDSFEIFYRSNEERIAEIIDRGSQGEENQSPKSKRIKTIYDKIGALLNIGPHNDKYEVTYADAQLAFREFVSVIAYLSQILSETAKEGK